MEKLCLYRVSTEFYKILNEKDIYLDFMTNLHGLRENHRKITYTYALMKSYGICDYFEKLNLHDINIKDETVAMKYRQEGNAYYGVKDFNNAFKCYNKALANAPKNSREYILSIANRSAIFLETKFYNECLEDISSIKNCDYPHPHKLHQREKRCLNELKKPQRNNATFEDYDDNDENDENEIQFEIKLRYEKSDNVPFISSCLAIKFDADNIPQVYTTKELLPGDIVSVEKPFCNILDDNYQSVCCENCNKNLTPLIPCPNCTIVLFCSENCMNEAYETFHKYECPIIFTLKKTFHYVHLLAIRITLVALHVFPDIKEFKNLLAGIDGYFKGFTIFNFDFKTTSPTDNALSDDYVFDKKEQYKTIFCYPNRQETLLPNELLLHVVASGLISDLFLNKTSINQVFETNEDKNILKELIFHHILVSQRVYRSIVQRLGNIKGSPLRYAIGAFPFQGNIKFTCSNSSNVYPIFNGKKNYLLVTKRILPNDLLNDCSSALQFGEFETVVPVEFRQLCGCRVCFLPMHTNYDHIPLSQETIFKIIAKPSITRNKAIAIKALSLAKRYFDLRDYSECNKIVMIKIFQVLLDVYDLNIEKKMPVHVDKVIEFFRHIEILFED